MRRPARYSNLEESLNISTHALGFLLGIVAFYHLLELASSQKDSLKYFSSVVFGCSLVLLYASSTIYHCTRKVIWRLRMQVADHSAIFIMIAGSATPFSLVTLNENSGWTMFFLLWSVAIVGIVLKIFFTGRFKILSTLMYLAMGWVFMLTVGPLIENLGWPGFFWLLGGGLSYSIGALFYSLERVKLNHAIFHVFVLLGSYCHYHAIYQYVIGK